MCLKGFFVKKYTIAFCLCWCFALSAMLATEPAACIPAINLTWIGFNSISIFWTANIHLPSVRHCRFGNFGSFAPSGPHATTFSSSSCRCCLRLHLIAVFVDVFAFISVSSS
ncbi:hypothetical protein OUZ56_000675 [Daphnia magna]|uniref:Secreted protein n=1 Tax=Daphnia magna TaxID=35525 RepID=A0ABR0A125_9CRUS|nr:hypothetical protein OUZ56_000675 [Daphnia magna]